jgi:EAL domain-containing protein (putative c-di-GMP-specific phosphodiesterase class I)
VLIDRETRSVDAAMRHADEACYAAKASGRNRIRTYRDADTDIRSRHGIMQSVAHLDRALAEDRLVLNCQAIAPVFEGAEGDMHYEILLTMRTPEGELVPPSEFIQGAETYQRIALLDRWVVSRVLAWMAANPEALVGVSGMGINLSGQSVGDAAFADFVLDAFARTGAPTAKVCFEITETTAILNLDQARDFMQRMKSIGCRFALDDFGTGLSSYSYLRHLPVDMLKIDGIFIRQLAENAHDLALVRSINEIGHYLGKRTIAECVETAAVLECVREIGIDYAQGYHIGRPQPLDELFRKPVAV